MATNNKSFINKRSIKKMQSLAQKQIDNSYKNTYFDNNDTDKIITLMKRNMDDQINSLINVNDKNNFTDGNSLSYLYKRLFTDKDGRSTIPELSDAMQDESVISQVMDLYALNTTVKEYDKEIDTVVKYMPKLDEALDCLVESYLSADHFNKDNILIKSVSTDDKDINSATDSNITAIKEKYNITEKFKKIKDTLKYGESFHYILPYKKAMAKLLMQQNGNSTTGVLSETVSLLNSSDQSKGLLESTTIDIDKLTEGSIIHLDMGYSLPKYNEKGKLDKESIHEEVSILSTDSEYLNESVSSYKSSILDDPKQNTDIKVEINTNGIITSVLKQRQKLLKTIHETAIRTGGPLNTVLLSEVGLNKNRFPVIDNGFRKGLNNLDKKYKKFIEKGLKSPLYQDGLTSPTDKEVIDKDNIKVPGCVVKTLERCMVKPLYVDTVCIGYYYIECDKDLDFEQTTFTTTLGGLKPRKNMNDRIDPDRDEEAVIMKIAQQMSEKIDIAFINANQDIAKEIYTILRYNANHGNNSKVNKIRISFVPPEDMEHWYIEMDHRTHRGISKLQRGLYAAKLWTCLNITTAIAIMTRSNDKRVFYVKQNGIDTNISAILLGVINQIRRSNFNIRQIENMNHVLNMTGRFNDLVIPQNANGESPVNFEIMPGQQVNPQQEFMQELEEMAVNSTGVPLELVTARLQQEMATHFTMTNSRFLIKILNDQPIVAKLFSRMLSKIYSAEYGGDTIIEVELPPPIMLNFTNTSQILASGNEVITNIMQAYTGDEQDKEKFRALAMSGLMKYYFKSILPVDDITKIIEKARMESIEKTDTVNDDQSSQDLGNDDMSQY